MNRSKRPAWLLVAAGAVVTGASFAQPPLNTNARLAAAEHGLVEKSDLSVMTFNVKGLPWPIAQGRDAALERIGRRLANLRRMGRQPDIVVLQEAFTQQAKAIGEIAGYPYQIEGPYTRATPGGGRDGAWYLGEMEPAMLDSGLVILSDRPVLRVERAEFPQGACAGFDCLAAKGVLMVTVDVPGKGAVAIAATHMNSRKASGAPFGRTHVAYRRQAAFITEFLKNERPSDLPMVLAGDFNQGQRPVRIASLSQNFATLAGANGLREGLRQRMSEDARGLGQSPDAQIIRKKARDMQFLFDGTRWRLDPVGGEIPFGTEPGEEMLSDHIGFMIRYRLSPVGNGA